MISHSPQETQKFAEKYASKLSKGSVIALVGDLGSGKTCFVQGLAAGLQTPKNICVSSPTYVLLHEYLGGRWPLYHFDFYRLGSSQEALDLDLPKYFEGDGICVVEWADRFWELFPEKTEIFVLKMLGSEEREIQCSLFKNLVGHPLPTSNAFAK